jgi:hypothetical protein
MANPVKISDSLTLDSSVTAASSKAIKNLHEAISNENASYDHKVITVDAVIAANSTFDVGLTYVVGSNSLLLSYNGVDLYNGKQYTEVGTAGTLSSEVSLNMALNVGDEIRSIVLKKPIYIGTGLEEVRDYLEDRVDANTAVTETRLTSRIDNYANTSINTSLAVKATNPITDIANDTPAKWNELAAGVYWFNQTGCLIDQPSQYGFLVNICVGSDVFQIWNTQSHGPMYTRSGNSSGWATSWIEYMPRAVVAVSAIADLSSKGNGSYSISSATLAGVSGAWIVDKRNSLYTATCTSDPRVVLNSVDLTNWYSPYAYWHA